MRGARRDWLDALARRTVGGMNPGAPAKPGVTASDDRFSRTTALKLGFTSATWLSLGLWQASPARAQTRDGCFTECFKTHEKELTRRLQSCDDVFKPRQYFATDWRLYAGSLFGGTRDQRLAGGALAGLCYAKARWEVGGDKNDCYDGCEETCPSRRVQSVSSFAGALEPSCEVTPPHKTPPPEIPTPPNPDNDVCLICMGNGNVCCPGGSIEAGGLCACAPPEVECSYYAGSCA